MKEYVDNFVNHLTTKKFSENTIKNYKIDLIQFIDFMSSKGKNINEIDIIELEGFLATIKGKEATINRKISSIQSFFKYLKKMRVISNNPALELERLSIPERQPVYLQEQDTKKLLKVIKSENTERDKAIIVFFLHCGLRLSELVNCNLEDIQNDSVTVIGKGNKQRTIPLDKACLLALEKYLVVRPHIEGEKALFISEKNKRICHTTVQQLVEKYLEKAGLDTEKFHTHSLRHTCATMLSKSKVPVQQIQKILGHADLNTSMIYINVEQDELREAVNKSILNK